MILVALVTSAVAFDCHCLRAQTSIAGSSLALDSAGSTTLSGPGYLGTYLTVPAGGATINFNVNATEGGTTGAAPHMNIVIADSTLGLNITSTSAADYGTSNVTLPAGTYFVRAERDYAGSGSTSRPFTLNSLAVNTVSGTAATFSNSNTDANALAASDTYIANFRQGPATVKLLGVAPGTPVNVDLSRIAFNFGTSVPGSNLSGINAYLGNTGTTQQSQYQQALNQNFNAIVLENGGKWGSNEAGNTQPATPTMTGVDAFLNYAQAHGMTARMHNLIWGPTSSTSSQQQPAWVVALLNNAAAGDATAKTNLTNAITNRINYFVGGTAQRSLKYSEIDVYNESYHTGQNDSFAGNYWNVSGASGVANIYNQVAAAVAASGATTKTFVNEYNVLQNNGTNYATFYVNNIDQIRDAGGAVGGIGIQYYPNGSSGIGAGDSQHSPARIESTLQNLSVQGLPLSLNEFGVGTGGTTATVSTILTDSLRLMFGTPQATGFFMWGFQSENGGGNLFKPAAALYTVTTSNWNTMAITDVGKAWQDLLGIQDWDGNSNDGWSTHLNTANGNAPTVNADGTINFNGYYGDYKLTIGGKSYDLNFTKGTSNYTLLVNPVLGDFNFDGQVNNADLQAMLDALKDVNSFKTNNGLSDSSLLAIGDFNGDQVVNAADISGMFNRLASGGMSGVPEPATITLAAVLLILVALGGRSQSALRARSARTSGSG
jgi:GH35 family endo-1,4-beta-xylanase